MATLDYLQYELSIINTNLKNKKGDIDFLNKEKKEAETKIKTLEWVVGIDW